MVGIPALEIGVITRIFVAVILGLLIGIQRERMKVVNKLPGGAGLRTHALVCMGSTLITAVGSVLFPNDPARLAASIMTGIGFIGAGTIIATQGRIKGLVSATTIWVAAAIGIAVGLGLYLSSAIATILTILILELRRFEKGE